MDNLDMLDAGGVGEIQQGGASSTEDFWMFFSFAMILLVFVLMNYVNYLNSLVVKVEREQAAQEEVIEDPPPEEVAEERELHVIIKLQEGEDLPHYFIGEEETELSQAELAGQLNTRLAAFPPSEPYKVFVHAPGQARYKWVFDASYAATEAAEARGMVDFNVHLVYEESQ